MLFCEKDELKMCFSSMCSEIIRDNRENETIMHDSN